MKVSLAYSPCPNDTFMFHAMVKGLVDTEELSFDVTLSDVEDLNQRAVSGTYDISKMSYHGWFNVMKHYRMLTSGSALGYDCGPLCVCKAGNQAAALLKKPRVAIPGIYTTGALLYDLAFEGHGIKVPMLFSDIGRSVLSGECDLGILIHESRFTYAEQGLELVCDLGSWWQKTSDAPIPLGGIAVKQDLGEEFAQKVERVLHRSILYAMKHPEASANYVAAHAQEISEDVLKQHIEMFVNKYSLSLGDEGLRAIELLKNYYLKHKEQRDEERDYQDGWSEKALSNGEPDRQGT
jgi:1,4-dihydroxy-6-naphthoate synthase